MRDESRLNDLAAAEIAALEAEGIKPTASDVVLLNSLAWAVETPEARRSLARGVPVPVGASNLWPPTLYAEDWIERVGDGLGGNAGLFANGYAMAHAYSTGGELDCEGREAEKRVLRWVKSLRVTAEELLEAIEQVNAQESGFDLPPDAEGKPMSVGDFSVFLAATNGGDVEFWERRCARSYACSVMSRIVRQNAAEGQPIANDAKIQAERALGYAAEKIRARAKAEQPNG